MAGPDDGTRRMSLAQSFSAMLWPISLVLLLTQGMTMTFRSERLAYRYDGSKRHRWKDPIRR